MAGFLKDGRCYSTVQLRAKFDRAVAHRRHLPELVKELRDDGGFVPPARCRDLGLPAGSTYGRAARRLRSLFRERRSAR